MSASAPAGIANRNIGSVVAAWTIATMTGLGSSVVMSQPAAALYIHVPTLASTVAAQSTAYCRWRNGASEEVRKGARP
jgi:hypothetical protein